MSNSLRWVIAAFLMGCCAESEAQRGKLAASISTMPEFNKLLIIDLQNDSDQMVCMSREEIDPWRNRILVIQNNIRAYDSLDVAEAYRDYRSINTNAPVVMVPSGRTTFEYDLSDFPLKRGRITIHGRLKMASCASLFGRDGPRWFYVPVEAVLDYPFDALPKKSN